MLPKIGKNKVPKVTPGYPKFWPFLAVSKMPKNIIFGGILCRGGMALNNVVRLSKLLKNWTNGRLIITHPLKVKLLKRKN